MKIEKKTDQEPIKEINENQNVSEFSVLAKNFILLKKQTTYTFPQLYQKAKKGHDYKRSKKLLELMEPIYGSYENHLIEKNEIDFSDMIRKATEYVENDRYQVSYKHILVDEFQDISPARAGLVKSMIDQDPSISLFVVGDDWQSIYRFTGSDLNMMINFPDHFGFTTSTILDTTFRFNNKIGEASSIFVQKNPFQIEKTLQTVKKSNKPEISTVKTESNSKGLNLTIEALAQQNTEKIKILVLARYHYLFNEIRDSGILKRLQGEYKNISIDLMSIHASKGKEADFVVVIGLLSDELPAEKPVDDILELLLPEKEKVPFAEERRLFYVALTRAKNRVYLIYNPLDVSPFISELISGEYRICEDEIITDEFPEVLKIVKCPECERGQLSFKKGSNGTFVGCSKFPMCRHTENVCSFCGAGILEKIGHIRKCTNPRCSVEIPVCPICGGSLLIRNGKYGQFLGCTNYRSDSEITCSYTRKVEAASK